MSSQAFTLTLPVQLPFHVELTDAYTAFQLKGGDVAGFLQRRTSNDVLALKVGEGHLNSFLQKTASIQCLFQLWRVKEHTYIALVEASLAEMFEVEAQRFKLMETFETTRLKRSLHLSVNSNPEPPEVLLGTLALPSPALLLGESAPCGTLFVENPPKLQHPSITLEAFTSLQVALGVLQFGSDYTHETKLPETTLERYAVSYTKGCYLGQETIAKVKTYGGLKRTVVGICFLALSNSSGSHPPQAGEDVSIQVVDASDALAASKVIGRWGRSMPLQGGGVYTVALLERAFRNPGQTLELMMEDGTPRQGTVELLPHLRLGVEDSQKDEQSWHRHYEAAMQQFVEGQLEQATQQMQALVNVAPEFWQAREGLGILLGRAERYTEAMDVLTALIEDNPNWPMAYTNLSIYALKLGDKDAAEHWKAEGTRIAMKLKFDEAMKAKKAHAETEAELRKAHEARESQLRERVNLFKQALHFAPTDALAHYGMATALQELQRYEEAVLAYQTTIEHHANHTQAYLGWAECLLALGQNDKAKTIAQQGSLVASQRGDLQPLTKLQAILTR